MITFQEVEQSLRNKKFDLYKKLKNEYLKNNAEDQFLKGLLGVANTEGETNTVLSFLIATHYWDGEGVNQSYKEARKWLEKAFNNGSGILIALSLLAKIIDLGLDGSEPDREYAFKLYEWGYTSGCPECTWALGVFYDNGWVVEVDRKKAFDLYKISAEKGNMASATQLISIYQDMGLYDEAIFWARKAHESGNSQATFKLGLFYDRGLGMKKSKRQAATYYKLAADQGHDMAQFNYGHMLFYGDGIKQNVLTGQEYISMALSQGNELAIEWWEQLSKNFSAEFDEY